MTGWPFEVLIGILVIGALLLVASLDTEEPRFEHQSLATPVCDRVGETESGAVLYECPGDRR